MNIFNKTALLTVSLVTALCSVSIYSMGIFEAARTGNVTRLQELIAAGANVNQQDHDGSTPLYFAAFRGHQTVVQTLIAAGANVHQANNDGVSPLHLAIICGNQAVIQTLIAAGANVNQVIYGQTPLHLAAEYGQQAVVETLIEAGANVNQRDHIGCTPSNFAAASGYHTVVALLTDYSERIRTSQERAPIIARIIATAIHPRLGAASPMGMLDQFLLRDIAQLTAQAEDHDARQPRQQPAPQ